MWRGLIGLLFVVAAVGCFVGARYAPDATNMYILIDLGCAALAGAVATQVPGAAAFFYSYIAVLVITLGVNSFFVLAASLAIASTLSYSAYHYLVSGSMSRLPEPDCSGLRDTEAEKQAARKAIFPNVGAAPFCEGHRCHLGDRIPRVRGVLVSRKSASVRLFWAIYG